MNDFKLTPDPSFGTNTLIIGKDIVCTESNKLIVKGINLLFPIEKIDIEETITEREHYLISSALRGMEFLRLDKEFEDKLKSAN